MGVKTGITKSPISWLLLSFGSPLRFGKLLAVLVLTVWAIGIRSEELGPRHASHESKDMVTMLPSFKTVVIVNPRSANGATGRKWPAIRNTIEREFEDRFDVVFTESPLHAIELTRHHLQKGYERIIAVGGDGLINEVVNGFFEEDQNLFPRAVLGILSVGSGGDFIRTMGWERDLSSGARRLNGTQTKSVDVGRAIFHNAQGGKETRYFLNVADFGSGGAVVEKVNRTSKALGGSLSFLWGILSTLPRYKNKEIYFTIDGGEEKPAILNNLIVANGQYYGGGLKPAPDAAIDDGLFQHLQRCRVLGLDHVFCL